MRNTHLSALVLLYTCIWSVSSKAMSSSGNLTTVCVPPSDEYYNSLVRTNLATFHKNLDAGQPGANAAFFAPDLHWHYDGSILVTREVGIAALVGLVESALKGVNAQDTYKIVDGNRGATLFRIRGKQSGPFLGLPLQSDGQFNVQVAERFTFDSDALARDLVTTTPVSIMKEQMSGSIDVSAPLENISLPQNPQSPHHFRDRIRKIMSALHLHANDGTFAAAAESAIPNVVVDENGSISHGKDAFIALITSKSAGRGAFPSKLFHDFEVLADGKLGAVDFIWQGAQQSRYMDIEVKESAVVTVRGMLFFEFNGDGLIEKAVGVWDEGVVEAALTMV